MAQPVIYAENGIVIDNRARGYAVYVVDADLRPLTSAGAQNQAISALAKGMKEVLGEWHVYSLAIGVPPNTWKERFLKTEHPLSVDHVAAGLKKSAGVLFERRVYIVVPISNKLTIQLKDNGKEFLQAAKRTLTHSVKRALRLENFHVQLLEQFEEERRVWHRKFRAFLKLHPASQVELETWLRHGFYRGGVAPDSRFPKNLPAFVSSDGVIHPQHHLGIWTHDGVLKESFYNLKVIQPTKNESYQTFYNVLRVPNEIDESDASGYDWVHQVEYMDIPVDVAMHIRVEDPIAARKNLRKKRLRAESQWKEYAEGGETPPLELEVDIEHTAELEQKLRMRDPLVHVKTVIGFGAESSDRLAEYRNLVQSNLALTDLVQPPADQLRLWQSFYPWGRGISQGYEIPMDAGVFAAGLPFSTLDFGDSRGFYLGKTLNERSVFMDPRRPAQELNMQPSILLCGGLGSGKTNTAEYIAATLYSWGAKGFIQDPKGHDYDNFYKTGARVNMIRLREEGAALNPFRLGVEGVERDLLDIVFNNVTHDDNTRDIRSALIGQALTAVKAQEVQDMHTFGNALAALRQAETREVYVLQLDLLLGMMGDLLSNPLGRVLFGKDSQGQTPQDYDVTIVDTSGLTIPNGTPKTLNERLSVALYYAVAGMGMGYFSNLPQSVLKFMILDEAWTLRKFSQGVDLVDNLLRKSRSLNIVPLMLMQNATDFANWGESIDGLFAWRFVMRQNSQVETAAALKLAGLDHEDAQYWYKVFASFRPGEGLVVDALGRVQQMQVEMLPHKLLAWFDTTPKADDGW
nr:conjugal transfer protein TraC [Bacilli bacterium]